MSNQNQMVFLDGQLWHKATPGEEKDSERIERGAFEAISDLREMFSRVDISPGSREAGFEKWMVSEGFSNWFMEVEARVNHLKKAPELFRRLQYVEKIQGILQRAIHGGELSLANIPEGAEAHFSLRKQNGTVTVIYQNYDSGDIPF